MPRILRIINRLNLGGPTYNAAYLSKYLSDGYETLLVAGLKDESEASSEHILEDLGITPVYIKNMYRSINPFKDSEAYGQIKKLIKDFKPDIVHTHAAKAGALGRMAAADSNVKAILHTFHGHVFHSYFNPVKTKLFLQIERYLASKSHKIIAISEKQKIELGETYKVCKKEKIEVIPLGFKLEKFTEGQDEKRIAFRAKYNLADDEVAVGIIGRLVPIKNHQLFLRAFKKVHEKQGKKVRAFVIGDGESMDVIENITQELNLDYVKNGSAGQVSPLTYTSWIKDIDEANAGLDVIALSSLNEGTPVSLIEAQAANKPIVSTNVGGVSDVVIPGKTALLSESNDVDGFADNLLKLVADKDLRNNIGKDGYEHVQARFSYKRLCSDMDDLYRRLLE